MSEGRITFSTGSAAAIAAVRTICGYRDSWGGAVIKARVREGWNLARSGGCTELNDDLMWESGAQEREMEGGGGQAALYIVRLVVRQKKKKLTADLADKFSSLGGSLFWIGLYTAKVLKIAGQHQLHWQELSLQRQRDVRGVYRCYGPFWVRNHYLVHYPRNYPNL